MFVFVELLMESLLPTHKTAPTFDISCTLTALKRKSLEMSGAFPQLLRPLAACAGFHMVGSASFPYNLVCVSSLEPLRS